MRWTAYVVCAVVVFAGSQAVAGFNMDITLDDITFGEQVAGVETDKTDLKGRVVLVEFWGISCSGCLHSLPGLASLYEKHKKDGFLVLGAHSMAGPERYVKAVAAWGGVTYPVFMPGNMKGGYDFAEFPHLALFDHTGKCIYRGESPPEAMALVADAVKKATPAVLEGRQLVKLKSLSDKLKQGKITPGGALNSARGKLKSKDPKTAEEAQYVVDTLTAYGQKLIERGAKAKDTNAQTCCTYLDQAANEFKGTAIGRDAGRKLKKAKKKKSFMKDLSAWKKLDEVKELELMMQPLWAGDWEEFKKTHAATIRKMSDLIKQIKKARPDSKVATEAEGIAVRFQIGEKD